MMWCGHCGTGLGAKIQPTQNKHCYYCPKKERAYKEIGIPSAVLLAKGKSIHSQQNGTDGDRRWERGRHCSMTRSLNVPVTNDTVWKVVTKIASNSHTLKAHIKNQMMTGQKEAEKEVKAEVRNLQKTKQQYSQERTDLETAIVRIQTDRVLKRINEKQTKDILASINTELKEVTARLEDVDNKLKDTGNQQRRIDWVGHFHKTY